MAQKSTEILNKEVFYDDPTTYALPNDGVAKVGPLPEDQNSKEWEVAKYELEHFVCKGSYHEGLTKILTSFNGHLDHMSQPAVWVSGFFGSGKSHLVRVLEFLWSDLKFADGSSARGICTLPDDIVELLKELTTDAKRTGGIWSAAGTLSSGDSDDPRLAVIQVILRSAGFPDNPDLARLHLWLAQEEILDEMREKLRAIGKEKDMDLPFVSEHFSRALLDLKPKLADSPTQVTEFLSNQFISDRRMTNDELVNMMKEVFLLKSTVPGKMPLVLLVLDEVQQYLTIGEGSKQILAFQEIIEACCKNFGGRLLVVATGQEALQANALLQKLQGRFSIRVNLQEKDVDTVLHQTVLRKKQTMLEPLGQVLDQVSGEISKHLGGTKLAHKMEDDSSLILDYPLLPTRKRFWDKILHAVDTGGMSTQLRTQLRLAYEGSRSSALGPIGTVIPADFIYTQLNTYLIQNGLLASEINEMISRENDGTPDGVLRSRICALIFLIQYIDESFGVVATADTLSDLLITDLTKGSDNLRKKVPTLLEDLYTRGTISDVGSHIYHIQTKEGKEWDSDYQTKLVQIKADDTKIMFKRDELLRKAVESKIHGINIVQGKSKTPRQIDLTVFGSEKPEIESSIPLWVRHGWEIEESVVKRESQEEGNESPLIMMFLPRLHHNEIKNEIAGMLAATLIIENRPPPTTEEGNQAKTNIEAKWRNHSLKLDQYISNILVNTKMYPGGGIAIDCPDLVKAVSDVANNAILRMFPRFGDADAIGWDRVVIKVKADSKSPLEAIGFQKPTEQHPVCKEILNRLNSGPKMGSDIRNAFDIPPFGWSKDAIDGAIIALCASEHVRGYLQHKQIPAKEIDKKILGKMEFRIETIVIGTNDKIALKGLCTSLNIPPEIGNEVERATKVLDALKALASTTGGEKPLPEMDIPLYLGEIRVLSGNNLVKALVDRHSEIKNDVKKWEQTTKRIQERFTPWNQLNNLIDHAHGLPLLDEITPQCEAICEQRSLLSDPDPVPPLLKEIRSGIREALKNGENLVKDAQALILHELKGDQLWKKLSEEQQENLKKKYHLILLPTMKLENDDAIIAQVKKTPINSFDPLVKVIEGCMPHIRSDMAKILEPKTVTISVSSGVIVKNEKELDKFLSDVRVRVKDELEKGNPVMLK